MYKVYHSQTAKSLYNEIMGMTKLYVTMTFLYSKTHLTISEL